MSMLSSQYSFIRAPYRLGMAILDNKTNLSSIATSSYPLGIWLLPTRVDSIQTYYIIYFLLDSLLNTNSLIFPIQLTCGSDRAVRPHRPSYVTLYTECSTDCRPTQSHQTTSRQRRFFFLERYCLFFYYIA